MSSDLPDHVQRNREAWDTWSNDYAQRAPGEWALEDPTWGELRVPEAELHVLPDAIDGMDAIELGCGTAYFSAWLARRGARPVGIDNSPRQLDTARQMQEQFDLHFPVHLGNAEALPFPDGSFDLALSEYGASIWCDPYRWIPEAARVLRPDGWLIFLCTGLLTMLCSSPEDTEDVSIGPALRRPLFGMHRFEWPDGDSVEFHLPHGEWIRLLRTNGFTIEQLIELQPPAGSTAKPSYVPLAWAQQWPCEEIWVARRR